MEKLEASHSQVLISNSPYCLSYNSYDVHYFGEFVSGSTNKSLIDVFLFSHRLSACINIVRRIFVLVTHRENESVNPVIARSYQLVITANTINAW